MKLIESASGRNLAPIIGRSVTYAVAARVIKIKVRVRKGIITLLSVKKWQVIRLLVCVSPIYTPFFTKTRKNSATNIQAAVAK